MNSRVSSHKHEHSEERATSPLQGRNPAVLARALDEVQYGEVTIKIQGGSQSGWISYERERVGSGA